MKRLFLSFIFSLLFTSNAIAATYYATAGGSGTTCSEASPCTLAYAIGTKGQNGDTVNVAAGTYNLGGNVTVANSITITGASRDTVTVSGGTITFRNSISISGIGFVTTSPAITLGAATDNLTNITINNCKFTGLTTAVQTGSTRTTAYSITGLTISNNLFTTVTTASTTRQLYLYTGALSTVNIFGNEVANITSTAGGAWGIVVGANDTEPYISGVNVYNNNVHDFSAETTSSYCVGIIVYGSNCHIYNNTTATGNTGYNHSGLYTKVRYSLIHNNTITNWVGTNIGSLSIKGSEAALSNEVYYNTITSTETAGGVKGVYLTGTGSFHDNCLRMPNLTSSSASGLHLYDGQSLGYSIDMNNNTVEWGNGNAVRVHNTDGSSVTNSDITVRNAAGDTINQTSNTNYTESGNTECTGAACPALSCTDYTMDATPVISNGLPSETQACTANPIPSITLSITCTDDVGCTACKTDLADIDIDLMATALTQAGTTWSTAILNVACGTSTPYYVKCEDVSNNETASTTITVAVQAEEVTPPASFSDAGISPGSGRFEGGGGGKFDGR